MQEEIWRDIPDYEGYQASNLGNIRTHNKISYAKKHGTRHWKDRILKFKSKSIKTGYRVDLWKNGKPKTMLVCRLVATTFLENLINTKMTVNHKDGNRFNNNVKNLEWTTLRENIRHAFGNGLCDRQIAIKIIDKKDENTKVFRSMSLASSYINKNKGYISAQVKKNKYEDLFYKWEVI